MPPRPETASTAAAAVMVGVGADVRGGVAIDESVVELGVATAIAARVTAAEKVKTAAAMARLERRKGKNLRRREWR